MPGSEVGLVASSEKQPWLYAHASVPSRAPRYTLNGPGASDQLIIASVEVFASKTESFTSETWRGVKTHVPPMQASSVQASPSLHIDGPPSSMVPSQSSSLPLQISVAPGCTDASASLQSEASAT